MAKQNKNKKTKKQSERVLDTDPLLSFTVVETLKQTSIIHCILFTQLWSAHYLAGKNAQTD